MAERAVFDCMLFLQAAARSTGPAAACLSLALQGAVELILSPEVIAEVRDVLTRPKLVAKFPSLVPERVGSFLNAVAAKATVFATVPAVFPFQRDPKDAMYLDLAIAAKAHFLVTRDNDLLDLEDAEDAEGQKVRGLCPGLRIIDPASFLRSMLPKQQAPETSSPKTPVPAKPQSKTNKGK